MGSQHPLCLPKYSLHLRQGQHRESLPRPLAQDTRLSLKLYSRGKFSCLTKQWVSLQVTGTQAQDETQM